MRGKLERLDRGSLYGWLFDDTAPERRVAFELAVNGEVVRTGVADRRRGDLLRAELGDGGHGLLVRAMQRHLAPGDNTLELRADGISVSSLETWYEPSGTDAVRTLIPLTVVSAEAVAMVATALVEGPERERRLLQVVEPLFQGRRWAEVIAVCAPIEPRACKEPRLLIRYGRALLHAGSASEAVDVLRRAHELRPNRHGDAFYLARALQADGQWQPAREVLRDCIRQAPDESRYHLEFGRTLVRIAYGSYGVAPENRELLPEAVRAFEAAAELAPEDWGARRELIRIDTANGRGDEALRRAREAVAALPDLPAAHAELARSAMRFKAWTEAAAAGRRALALAPDDDTTATDVRLAEWMSDLAALPHDCGVRSVGTAPARELVATPAAWLALSGISQSEGEALVARHGHPWAAGIAPAPGAPAAVVRRSFVSALLSAGLVAADAAPGIVLGAVGQIGRVSGAPGPAGTAPPASFRGRRVMLLSSFGIRKFGGAEQFLAQMARLYQELGNTVHVVGTRNEFLGERGVEGGLPYAYVRPNPDAILRFAVEEGIDLVHVLSGNVFEALTALRHTRIPVVHGVHYWRELFTPRTPHAGYYPDVDGETAARPQFTTALRGSAILYGNSDYTARTIERVARLRPPVVYSLPDDRPAPELVDPSGRDHVLLVNTRSDKGFDLLLEVAARLPHRAFKAISSQSSLEAAQRLVDQQRLQNVELVDRLDTMDNAYRDARLVAVPSYRFIESFSRTIVEAQRHGVPVLGADRGNVPLLLERSGIVLPEDPGAWAEEIEALFDDDAWRRHARLALRNSARYAFSGQRAALDGLVDTLDRPLLVGVGPTLADILAANALVATIVRELGRRVDVVVARGGEALLFAAALPGRVNHVFADGDDVRDRRYETVLLTAAFGELDGRFACDNVVAVSGSGDDDLRAAAAAFGFDAGARLERPAIGGMSRGPTSEPRVGVLGRPGQLAEPAYAALADRLSADGVTVVEVPDLATLPDSLDPETVVAELSRCRAVATHHPATIAVAAALSVATLAIGDDPGAVAAGTIARDAEAAAQLLSGMAGSSFLR